MAGASNGPRENKVDIKAIITDYALELLGRKGSRREKKLKEKGYIDVTIDWKRVLITTEPPVYDPEPGQKGTPKVNVLFNTSFTNRTDKPQKYSFCAERSTRSSCTVEIEKAVTTGIELNVKLATPCQILETNAGFKRELTLTRTDMETIDEEIRWAVNSEVEVLEGHVGEAKLIVLEEKYDGRFTLVTRMSGVARAIMTNLKDNNSFVTSYEVPIVTAVQNSHVGQGSDVIRVDPKTQSVICTTVGQCHFKYGVKQEVEVDQRKF